MGYLLAGVPGALLATVGIFLPAFIFVSITGPLIPRLRESPILAGLLDGANVVSLALMAGVTWQLGQASAFEPIPALIALVSLVLLFRTEINPVWSVIGGGRYRTPLLDILSLMCRLPHQSRGSQKGRCSGPKGSNNSPRSTGQGYSRPTGPLGPTTSLLSPKRLMTRASPPSCSN